MNIFKILLQETQETIKRPNRISRLFDLSAFKKFIEFQKIRLLSQNNWNRSNESLQIRRLSSYEDYIKLQKSKLQFLDLKDHEVKFRQALKARLQNSNILSLTQTHRVLCLGARLGGEVAAFRDLGCFAIGVDLNPGSDNPWVLYGDFNRLEYPNQCVDIVYTNSLDHALDLHQILSEVKRILANQGVFIVEADPGTQEVIDSDLWATLSWETVQDLQLAIEHNGFKLINKVGFSYPRNGTCMIFHIFSD